MPLPRRPVALAEEDREELRQMSVSGTLTPADVLRARLILMLAEGRSYADIQQLLGTTAPTIARWKKRFIQSGVAGLIEQRSNEPKTAAVTPELRDQVIAATWRGTDNGSARWSCRALAKELGINKDVVHRIWRSEGLRPHRLEQYMAPGKWDGQRKSASAHIVGLYLRSSQHVAAFCAGEKYGRRPGPVMPEPLEAETLHQQPHGRLSLYSALAAAQGTTPEGSGLLASDECVSFLTRVLDSHKASPQITVIVDRLKRADISALERLLQEYPNVVLHLAPSYSAWLHRVEDWCSWGEGEAVSTGKLDGPDKLTRKLMRHIRACSRTKNAIQWVSSGIPEAPALGS